MAAWAAAAMDWDMYELTESVPYLLNRAGVSIGEMFGRRLVEFELSVPMYRVLAMLKQKRESTLGELSEVVSVEVSTLSRLVGVLVKRRLLSRTRPSENGRIVIIRLTSEGEALTQKLIPLAMEFERTAVGGMSKEEIAALKSALKRMNANLSEFST